MKVHYKSWLSPLVAVLYSVVAVSGILMLFRLKVPGMHGLHEWCGILCVIAVIFHLVLNWSIFVSYFRNKKATVGVGAGILLVILTLFISSGEPEHVRGGDHHGHSSSHVFQNSR